MNICKSLWLFWILAVALIMGACTMPVKPETPKEQLVFAYATYEGVTRTVADMVTVGRISVDDAERYQAQLKSVHATLDQVAVLLTSQTPDEPAALALMRGAITILNQIAADARTSHNTGGSP